jgi:hypothetical protein
MRAATIHKGARCPQVGVLDQEVRAKHIDAINRFRSL